MISSPSHRAWRCPGGSRFPRLINVPFVEPKSSTKYWPLVNVIRAWRRDTFASGSSVSRSTSGKIPASASQRPICDSLSLNGNCLPLDRPFSITSLACGLARDAKDPRLSPEETRPPANSGFFEGEAVWAPFPLSLGTAPRYEPEGGAGRSGAPHSSQYWEPSKFSVLHLSQVIINRSSGLGR